MAKNACKYTREECGDAHARTHARTAMIMNVNEPETRGIALALQTTLDDLGKGLGPAIVAVMISGLGRESAFFWATAGWIPCGT